PDAVAVREGECQAAAGNCTHGELTLGADVPHVAAEADGKAESAQEERGGLERHFAEAVKRAHRLDEEGVEGDERVVAEAREEQAAAEESKRRSEERREITRDRRGLGARLEPRQHHGARPRAPRPRARPSEDRSPRSWSPRR